MFSRPGAAVRLEIGFGGGANLITQACAHPAIGFIGCEPFVNGMAKILASIEEGAIDNIRLYAGDALELVAWLPAASLTQVDLLYPDPWPKRRHWKRRVLQERPIAMLAPRLRPAGPVPLAPHIPHHSPPTPPPPTPTPPSPWIPAR